MAEKNELLKTEIDIDFLGESVRGLIALQPVAQLLASADIVPKAFQSKPANVLIALNMAQRMNAEPLMVMQNLYIVNGNPSWSSKFLIACFNTCGRFSSIKYEFIDEENTDSWGCRAYCTELATNEKQRSVDVTIKMAKDEGWYGKAGSKWKTMPQLMMQYRAAAFLIRTVAPEISMGLQTAEEIEDTIDIHPLADGSYGLHEKAAETQNLIDNTPVTTVDMPAPAIKVQSESEKVTAAVAPEPKVAQKRQPSF